MKVHATTTVNAKSEALGKKEALKMAAESSEIYASKGTKTVHLDLRKEKPSAEVLAGIMLGPTGNLRAPTLRIGKTLLIGFDQETYDKLLNN
jgi:arsenate reductase-like glutaredoxin family protein